MTSIMFLVQIILIIIGAILLWPTAHIWSIAILGVTAWIIYDIIDTSKTHVKIRKLTKEEFDEIMKEFSEDEDEDN